MADYFTNFSLRSGPLTFIVHLCQNFLGTNRPWFCAMLHHNRHLYANA